MLLVIQLLKIYPFWAQMNADSDSTDFAIRHTQEILNSQKVSGKLNIIDFTTRHLQTIENLTDKGRIVIENLTHKQLPKSSTDMGNHSYLSHQENWMGKNNFESSALHNEPSVLDSNNSQRPDVNYDENLNMSWSSIDKKTVSDETFEYNSDSDSFEKLNTSEMAFHSTPIKEGTQAIINDDKTFKNSDDVMSKPSGQYSKKVSTCFKLKEKQKNNQKGQFVSRFPGFKACHALKVKSRVKSEIQIRSGCKLGPQKIVKINYKIRESSIFDSLAEIFCFMCKNLKGFDNFCESTRCADLQSCFLNAIHAFCKNGKAPMMYKCRGQILYAFGQVTETSRVIDIIDAPGRFLSKMLVGDNANINFKKNAHDRENKHFSVKQLKKCMQCSFENKTLVITLELTSENISISDLNEHIHEFFLNTTCNVCLEKTLHTEYILGTFLAINVERYNIAVFFNHLPKSLKILSTEYILSGIISVKNAKNSENKHYTAFCRSSDDHWFERDNTNKPKQGYIKSPPRITLAMVFYILADDVLLNHAITNQI